MSKSGFAVAALGLILFASLVGSAANAQAETENRLASSARRELIGRNFKLLSSNIRIHRVTLASQKKLAKAYALTAGEPRELISTALGEIMALPRLNAVCTPDQLKNNIAYRGTSMMYDSFGFTFKPSREIHCEQLSIREIEMKPLELTETSMKIGLTIDQTTQRTAQCLLSTVDGVFHLWRDVTARCSLLDGEGTFDLDID